jgi:hypothetical protein
MGTRIVTGFCTHLEVDSESRTTEVMIEVEDEE